jgi:hypothetical protein
MTQEPVAWMSPDESAVALTKLHESWVPLYTGTQEKYRYGTPLLDAFTTPPAAQRQHEEEEVDCPRCGHCCAQREWMGLTEQDFSAINQSCLTKLQAATSAESILKEKNT